MKGRDFNLALDLEAADLAASALGMEGLRGLTMDPVHPKELHAPFGRLVAVQKALRNAPKVDRSEWTFLATAHSLTKEAIRDPAGGSFGLRTFLWSALRRGKGISKRARRALTDLYDASQHGRPEWQLRGRRPVEILGDSELGPGGELAFTPAQEGVVRSPAARILELAGFFPDPGLPSERP